MVDASPILIFEISARLIERNSANFESLPAWMIHASVLCRVHFAIRCFDSTYKNPQQNQNKQISTWIQRWLRILMRVNSKKQRRRDIAHRTVHITKSGERAQEKRWKHYCKISASIVCSGCLLINFLWNGNASTPIFCAFHWRGESILLQAEIKPSVWSRLKKTG